MDYVNRLPFIGGLNEIAKSKKGTAFIIAVIALLIGQYNGADPEFLLQVMGLSIAYITGQSIVDSRKDATAIIELLGTEEETSA